MDDPWLALSDELQAWQDQQLTPTLWWRDDDARQHSEALQRLCQLSQRFEIPLSLAVIPCGADRSLLPFFESTPDLSALLHGYQHISHAQAGQRNCELGDDRPVAQVLAELEQGLQKLRELLGDRFVEVLVPPWNRLTDDLIDRLMTIGVAGLSTLGPREQLNRAGLRLNHVHIDLINWKQGRCFAGDRAVLGQLIEHLRQRRLGQVDADEATGLMSHHLAHDQGCWDFCEQLFEFLADRPVRWLTARQCFGAELVRLQ